MMTVCGHTSFYKAATNMALFINLKIIIDIFKKAIQAIANCFILSLSGK